MAGGLGSLSPVTVWLVPPDSGRWVGPGRGPCTSLLPAGRTVCQSGPDAHPCAVHLEFHVVGVSGPPGPPELLCPSTFRACERA